VRIEAGIVDALEATHSPWHRGRLRVALVVPQSGPLGMVGPSALDAALLATHEVNVLGGARGAYVELVLLDGGRRPSEVAGEVGLLVDAGAVDVVLGFHTSDVHRALEARVAGRTPYLFTPPHEGGPRRTGVVCLGSDPTRQLSGAVLRLSELHGVRRWALLGNDYIWPQAVHARARTMVAATGGRVVLDRLVPMGHVGGRLDVLVEELRGSRADAVLLSLVGRDLALFNGALRHSGLDRRLVRLSGSLEENGLLACDGDRTGTLYAAMSSFATLSDDRRLGLAARHRALLGAEGPVLDSYAEGVYDGVHLVASLAARQLLRPDLVGPAVAETLAREGRRDAAWGEVHLARADGLAFEVVA
jgi:urea transport system substrate-binding protein